MRQNCASIWSYLKARNLLAYFMETSFRIVIIRWSWACILFWWRKLKSIIWFCLICSPIIMVNCCWCRVFILPRKPVCEMKLKWRRNKCVCMMRAIQWSFNSKSFCWIHSRIYSFWRVEVPRQHLLCIWNIFVMNEECTANIFVEEKWKWSMCTMTIRRVKNLGN